MPIRVFDFFSGCGGTSKGFQQAGHEIMFALDCDDDAALTYSLNFPNVVFFKKPIEDLSISELDPLIRKCGNDPILFCCCAPCQPFTRQKTRKREDDERINLLEHFGRLVRHFLPEFIFVENVPGLQEVAHEAGPLPEFERLLDMLNYSATRDVVESQKFGIPQYRRRLVLIASRSFTIRFPSVTHGSGNYNPGFATVRDYIGDYKRFPPIAAGETHQLIDNHRASALSPLNLERIRSTPPEGTRRDWPGKLRLACHENHSGHGDVYGRMRWDYPSTGLTTRCNSLSNGRFGHPEQHRAISLREAASLQTFSMDFPFRGSLASVAKQIGNAVPVLLARKFGLNFNDILDSG